MAAVDITVPEIRRLFDLSGEKALITGGGGGIGFAIALGFKEFGASEIALIEPSEEKLEEASRAFREKCGYEPLTIVADVSKKEQVEKAVEKVIGEFGRVDILVNSHGIFQWMEAEKMSEEDWDRMMSVNLKGVFLMCQAVGRHMIARRRGKIINIASGKEIRIKDLINLIMKLMGYKGEVVYTDPRPGDVRRHLADISLAKKIIGYSPKTDYMVGLRRTIEWYKKQLIGNRGHVG